MNDEDTMDWRRRWMYICWDQKHFAPNPPESPFLSAPLDTVGNLHHLCILQLEYVEKKITFGMEIEVTGLPFMDILLPKKFAMLESTFIDSTPIWLQKISPTTAKNYKTESSVFGPKIPDFFADFEGLPNCQLRTNSAKQQFVVTFYLGVYLNIFATILSMCFGIFLCCMQFCICFTILYFSCVQFCTCVTNSYFCYVWVCTCVTVLHLCCMQFCICVKILCLYCVQFFIRVTLLYFCCVQFVLVSQFCISFSCNIVFVLHLCISIVCNFAFVSQFYIWPGDSITGGK